MNAIQFGRWLGERRHACGWTSQRALASAAQRHPYTAGLHISEAFLARLEAGLLSHPFRGTVRERVLALAWLVCKTPRQVRGYLSAAGLTDLTSDELHRLAALRSALSTTHSPAPMRLPRRAAHLVGREQQVAELADLLTHLESGCVAVTGLAGIGKSAVVAEVLHLLSAGPTDGSAFADGIVTFDCVGRIGTRGLYLLLEDVAAVFGRPVEAPATKASRRRGDAVSGEGAGELSNVARATDRARTALRGRRTLVLLDGVDPRFPLSLALEALLASDPETPEMCWSPAALRGRVVLVTSRYLPRASELAAHVALRPLDRAAAIELLELSAGRRFAEAERGAAARLCEAAGGVPLAIEEVGTSLAVARLPLSPRVDPQLAVRLLDRQAGSAGMRERLADAIGALDEDTRRELRHLAASSAPRDAARWRWRVAPADGDLLAVPSVPSVPSSIADGSGGAAANDAGGERVDAGVWEVAAIAQLVRHSLVEPHGDTTKPIGAIEARYALNPLVRDLVLGDLMGETAWVEPAMAGMEPDPEVDAVRFLRRSAQRPPVLGGLKAAQQGAGG